MIRKRLLPCSTMSLPFDPSLNFLLILLKFLTPCIRLVMGELASSASAGDLICCTSASLSIRSSCLMNRREWVLRSDVHRADGDERRRLPEDRRARQADRAEVHDGRDGRLQPRVPVHPSDVQEGGARYDPASGGLASARHGRLARLPGTADPDALRHARRQSLFKVSCRLRADRLGAAQHGGKDLPPWSALPATC